MKGWALVTGGGKRIGRAICLELAAHGWDIVVHCHASVEEAQKTAEEIHKLGQDACVAQIDLANPAFAEALIPSLAEEIGMIDALVNNAALFEPDETDPDGTRHMAVNGEAPRILSKAFRDHLPPNERAAIVNLLDATLVAANFTAYGKSKEFLANLTRNMAKSFAPQVRVNGVAPLYVLPSPRQNDEAFAELAGNRRVTPEQVAEAVRRLLENPTANGEIVAVRP